MYKMQKEGLRLHLISIFWSVDCFHRSIAGFYRSMDFSFSKRFAVVTKKLAVSGLFSQNCQLQTAKCKLLPRYIHTICFNTIFPDAILFCCYQGVNFTLQPVVSHVEY
jgi:hypothetical protein